MENEEEKKDCFCAGSLICKNHCEEDDVTIEEEIPELAKKVKIFTISYNILGALFRENGEHHYRMIKGMPADGKIIAVKDEPLYRRVRIVVQSEEYPEHTEDEQYEEAGMELKGQPCQPVIPEIIGRH